MNETVPGGGPRGLAPYPYVAEIVARLRPMGMTVHAMDVPEGEGVRETILRVQSVLLGDVKESMAVLTGCSAGLGLLRDVLLGPSDAQSPYMIVVSVDHVFSFCRDDPDSIPGYLARWLEQKRGGNCRCCVCDCVCDEVTQPQPEEFHPAQTCSQCAGCCAKVCMDCFPSLPYAESEDSALLAFSCPVCRKQALACDAVRMPLPLCGGPKKLWAMLRTCLLEAGRERCGLVVAQPGSVTAVCDVALGRDGRVVVAPHRRAAERLMSVKGTVIGVGELPSHGRPAGQAAAERAAVDPQGRAFVSCGGGRVVELANGWRYVRSVFL